MEASVLILSIIPTAAALSLQYLPAFRRYFSRKIFADAIKLLLWHRTLWCLSAYPTVRARVLQRWQGSHGVAMHHRGANESNVMFLYRILSLLAIQQETIQWMKVARPERKIHLPRSGLLLALTSFISDYQLFTSCWSDDKNCQVYSYESHHPIENNYPNYQ